MIIKDNIESIINQFVIDIHNAVDREPLDGEETLAIADKVLKALGEFNANK